MTQNTLDAAGITGTLNAHTVTRSTGAHTLSGNVAISYDSTATKQELLIALRAIERELSRLQFSVSDLAQIPVGDEMTDESGNFLTQPDGTKITTSWHTDLDALAPASLAADDYLIFVEDGILVKIAYGSFITSAMLAANAVVTASIAAGAVGADELADTAVTPAAMTTSITVDAQGRVTAGT